MSRKKYISLCEVVWDFDDVTAKRQRRLKRFFDVDLDNQKLVPCSMDHVSRGNCIDLDQEIENKQTTIGSWGLWRWWKEENRFAKKRYTSEPYADLYPIQVIDCSTEPSEIVDQ